MRGAKRAAALSANRDASHRSRFWHFGSGGHRHSSGVTAKPLAFMGCDSGADCMDLEDSGAEDLSVSLALHVVLHDGGSDGYTLKHLVTGEQARLEGGAGLLHGPDFPRQFKMGPWRGKGVSLGAQRRNRF